MRIFKLFFLLIIFCEMSCLQALAQDSKLTDKKPEESKQEQPPAPAKDIKPITTIDTSIPLDQLKIMVRPLTKEELQVEANAWFELLRNKARQIAAARLGVKKTNEALSTDDEMQAIDSLKRAEQVKATADRMAQKTEEKLTQQAQENLGVNLDHPEAKPNETSGTHESDAKEEKKEEDSIKQAESGTEAPAQSAEAMKTEFLDHLMKLQDERTALSDRLEIVLASWELKGGNVETYQKYITAVSGIELDTSDASASWTNIKGWLLSKEGGQRWLKNILKFLVILLVTWLTSNIGSAVVRWLLDRKVKLTQLAENLISGTIKNVIFLIGFAIALAALEVDMTPVLAAIGATGLVVGLALQGTLSNFASGLLILINRPFDVGDVVTAGTITGTVRKMNLVSTTFRTFDNQTIHVPNNSIWNNVITNITANKVRRVDLEFGIGYEDDFEQAEEIIKEVLEEHELVLKDPEAVVVVHALMDSSVNIVCRPWAKTSDYWTVKTSVTREVKRRFDQAGISIPFPQQDIHVYSTGEANGRKSALEGN